MFFLAMFSRFRLVAVVCIVILPRRLDLGHIFALSFLCQRCSKCNQNRLERSDFWHLNRQVGMYPDVHDFGAFPPPKSTFSFRNQVYERFDAT